MGAVGAIAMVSESVGTATGDKRFRLGDKSLAVHDNPTKGSGHGTGRAMCFVM